MKLGIACAAVLGALTLVGNQGLAQAEPKFSADVPAKITTPDSTDTRIGTLNFKNGAPDEKTVGRSTTTLISCAACNRS